MSKHSPLQSLLVFVLLALSGCGGSDWSPKTIEESKRRGDTLITMLDRYKIEHGRYPESLDRLVPNYLTEIPQPTAGEKRWGYVTPNDGFMFNLWFRQTNSSATYSYCSEHREGTRWECDDGKF